MTTWPKHHIYSKATSSLILGEMIAELNRVQSTALQNMDQNHTKNINNGTDIQNNELTTTEPPL